MNGTSLHGQRWTTRIIVPGDRDAVQTLFAQVFGHAMSDALWRWKYGNNLPTAIGAWNAQGQLVAHYGGMARDISYFGSAARALQGSDLMVEPRERAVLTRSGPFHLVTKRFLSESIGDGKPFLLGFGFPNERHLRLGVKLGLYAQVGRVMEVAWPAMNAGMRWHSIHPVDWTAPATNRHLDRLWQAMRSALDTMIVGTRDAAWWRYRYAEHPVHEYHSYWLIQRLTQRRLAAFTLKPEGARCQLMDWVAPVEMAPAVITAARLAAFQRGATEIYGWFSENLAARIMSADGRLTDLGIGVPTGLCNPGPAPQQLDGRWWLTAGDTDFL